MPCRCILTVNDLKRLLEQKLSSVIHLFPLLFSEDFEPSAEAFHTKPFSRLWKRTH
ncbi:hypothetical protein KIL84_018027 [Mauremys mutica]|uniref:Uncharacterized protein n=1 Tax=Mauremys mutica TaxID=74926 RepID=A0A9D4B8L2_9SAUR|nr:hypothetical protein KIL84_018027 [Mauremys mutica]